MNEQKKTELVEEAQKYLGEEVTYKRLSGDVNYTFTGIGNSVGVSEDGGEKHYYVYGYLMSEENVILTCDLRLIINSIKHNTSIVDQREFFIKKRKQNNGM